MQWSAVHIPLLRRRAWFRVQGNKSQAVAPPAFNTIEELKVRNVFLLVLSMMKLSVTSEGSAAHKVCFDSE